MWHRGRATSARRPQSLIARAAMNSWAAGWRIPELVPGAPTAPEPAGSSGRCVAQRDATDEQPEPDERPWPASWRRRRRRGAASRSRSCGPSSDAASIVATASAVVGASSAAIAASAATVASGETARRLAPEPSGLASAGRPSALAVAAASAAASALGRGRLGARGGLGVDPRRAVVRRRSAGAGRGVVLGTAHWLAHHGVWTRGGGSISSTAAGLRRPPARRAGRRLPRCRRRAAA